MLFHPVEFYQHLLASAPLPTKALTQGLIWGAGDLAAQSREGSGEAPALRRTASFFATGVGSGALWTTYYDAADALVSPLPGGALEHTAVSLALEQAVWCPIVFALYQIPASVLTNGGAPADVPAAVRRQLVPMLGANLRIWTPANVVIYNVPLQWRVLASNCVDLVWGYVCASFAADACEPGDEECIVDAADALATPVGSRRPALVRRGRGLPRLVRTRAARVWLSPGEGVSRSPRL